MGTQATSRREITVEDRIRAVVATPLALAAYLTIDDPDRGPVPLELWPHQVEALRLVRRHRLVSIDKARQLGVTWGVLALIGLWDCIAYPVGETAIFSLDQDEANLTKMRVKRLYDGAPDWLHAAFPVAVDRVDAFGIEHPEGVSSVVCFAASGESGRGRTFRRVMADERARWKRKMGAAAAAQRMAAIRPAVGDTGSLVEVSTADGYDDHYETFTGAVDPGTDPTLGNGYVRLFIGALARPGRTREWVMRERARLDADEPGLGAQEYPLTAAESFRSSGRCVFDQDGLQDLLDHSTRPPEARCDLRRSAAGIIAENAASGLWSVWQWPEAGHAYLVTADTCGGQGGEDYAAVAVYDTASWDQVAALHGRIEPHVLERELVKAGWLYAGTDGPALLAPEANNHGQAVVALLREHRYPRIYASEVWDQRTQQHTRRLGWTTTPKSRPQLVSALQKAITSGSLGVRDAAAVGEMLRFEDQGNGRAEAAAGAHDDRVIAHGIAAFLLSMSATTKPKPTRKKARPYVPRVHAKSGY